MDTTLIIAIIGQIVTLAVVFIQQIYNNKNLKMQLDNGNKKEFYIEKRNVYKKLLKKANIEKLEESNFDIYYFGSIYDDIFLYGSKDIIIHINRIIRQCKVINNSDLTIKIRETSKKMLKISLPILREKIKEEYEKI